MDKTSDSILKQAVSLKRNCSAILIPDGICVELHMGQLVYVTQVLGGHFTVQTEGRLYRIWDRDRDALGLDPLSALEDSTATKLFPTKESCQNEIEGILKTCYDPEIPVNIVDLGLVYECHMTCIGETEQSERPLFRVVVQMTLTAPGCGMGPVLIEEMRYKIGKIPQVESVDIQLIFDPPWNQSMMSEVAKLQLGFI